MIVTKESSHAGGFDAKIAAANQANCDVIVLRRPERAASGLTFDNPATLISALRNLIPA